jgi:serine/threonine-protein kinase
VDRGSTVTITVSLGRPFVIVPDLAGRPVSEAIDELRADGFQVVINGAVGAQVLGTRPVAGTSVRSGSEIEIVSTE